MPGCRDGIHYFRLVRNFTSSLEKQHVISTEVVEGAKRPDHAAETTSRSEVAALVALPA